MFSPISLYRTAKEPFKFPWHMVPLLLLPFVIGAISYAIPRIIAFYTPFMV